MSDNLVKRLRDDSGDWLTDLAADRIEELEALLEKALEALATIMCNCVGDAERCGSKAAIEELTSSKAANGEAKGGKSEWKCPINYTGCTKNCGSYGCGN